MFRTSFLCFLSILFDLSSAKDSLIQKGDSLPSFMLPQLVGVHQSLPKYLEEMKAKGQNHLLLSFWSMTCVPCQLEMPVLKSWATENPKSLLVFVNEDKGNDRVKVADFVAAKLSDQRVILDSYQIFGNNTGVCKDKACILPALIVVDGSGVVKCALRGNEGPETLKKELDLCTK